MLKSDFERRAFAGKKLHQRVPDGFEDLWKEYDEQWGPALAHLRMKNIWPEEFGAYNPQPTQSFALGELNLTKPDPEYDTSFDPMHDDGGYAIQIGVNHWQEFRDYRGEVEPDENGKYEDEGITANTCNIAYEAYEYFTQTIGVDVEDIFRRWQALPSVFMPAKIANKYGTEKGSLNDLLDDAIRAYICGAPAPAIAMCRAALEMILKKHYLDPSEYQYLNKDKSRLLDYGLKEIIVLAEKKYDYLKEKKLTSLKSEADKVLHNYSKTKKLYDDDQKTIFQFLLTLKFLIAKAP